MSTEKKTVDSKDVIRMYYTTEQLLEQAGMEASMRVAMLEEVDFDKYQLTSDHQEFVFKMIEASMTELFGLLNRMIVMGVTQDSSYTPQGGTAAETTYVDLIDNKKYSAAQLKMLDKTISLAIRDYVLAKWFIVKGLADEAAICYKDYSNSFLPIIKKAVPLYKV